MLDVSHRSLRGPVDKVDRGKKRLEPNETDLERPGVGAEEIERLFRLDGFDSERSKIGSRGRRKIAETAARRAADVPA